MDRPVRSRSVWRNCRLGAAIGLGILLMLFLVGLTLSAPRYGRQSSNARPAVTIARETTALTEPLRPDGYVDYVAALNSRLSDGVSADNNAAIDLLLATGPTQLESAARLRFCELLGIPALPNSGLYFVPLRQFKSSRSAVGTNSATLDAQAEIARSRPWTADQYPDIAAWLSTNDAPLALVIRASGKPRWYAPLVPNPASGTPAVLSVALPLPQSARSAAEALCARAMLALGEGRPEAAWSDLLACHRLARLVGQGAFVSDGLAAAAIEQRASACDSRMADCQLLSVERLLAMERELAELVPLRRQSERIDSGERYFVLDAAAMVRDRGLTGLQQLMNGRQQGDVGLLDRSVNGLAMSAVDWDSAFVYVNRWFDRAVAIAREPDPEVWARQVDRLNSGPPLTPPEWSALSRPQEELGRLMGQVLVEVLRPPVGPELDVERRADVSLAFAHWSLSLAAFQRQHGHYPDALAELSPRFTESIPRHGFSAREPVYRRSETGYLLYAFGPNRIDEQGQGYSDQPRGDDEAVTVPPRYNP